MLNIQLDSVVCPWPARINLEAEWAPRSDPGTPWWGGTASPLSVWMSSLYWFSHSPLFSGYYLSDHIQHGGFQPLGYVPPWTDLHLRDHPTCLLLVVFTQGA